MKVQELISFINESDFSSMWQVDEEISDKFGKSTIVAENLNFDEHRWYSISTTVYQCEDGYVGVTGCSQLKSEMMSWDDADVTAYAEEYESVQTVTYRRK